jgi:hypothetical protein
MRQVKTVYCVVVISLAIILASIGGLLGIITAIIVLVGALPMFRAVTGAAEDQGAAEAVSDLRRHWHDQQGARATTNQSSDATSYRSSKRQ